MSDENNEKVSFQMDVRNLDKILKALKQKASIKIGILGDTARSGSSTTNATVGAAHEFGTSTLPKRSFLRMPLTEHLGPALESSQAFDKDTLKKVLASANILPWLTKIAVIAQGVVLEAFDSGGFGQWKPSQMDHKKNQQTLVETGQLRNSITYIVKEG